MKITDRLKVEHGVFLRQLRYLDDLLASEASKPVLAAAVETIARAEEHHTTIEDRLLYPELARVFGEDLPALRELAREHEQVRRLMGVVRSGEFRGEDVRRLIQALRVHMEREIHQIFPLVEEVLPPERLASLSSWEAEHVIEGLRDEHH
ncbi:MAG TPA: hemerythrin domain-containing protein [Vicinamibacteria bacterium]